MINDDIPATVQEDAAPPPPRLDVMVYDGVDSFSCTVCNLALGDRLATREHLLSVHGSTRYQRNVIGFACGGGRKRGRK